MEDWKDGRVKRKEGRRLEGWKTGRGKRKEGKDGRLEEGKGERKERKDGRREGWVNVSPSNPNLKLLGLIPVSRLLCRFLVLLRRLPLRRPLH